MFKSSAMIFKIAYHNLWRRKARTIVVITMIAVGIAVLTFINGLYDGWVNQMIDDTLYSDTCQVTIYSEGYRLSQRISDNIKNPQLVEAGLQKTEGVRAFFPRVKNDGMISTSRYSQGVQIIGIDAERERGLTNIAGSMIEGEYLLEPGERQIILGAQLADKLQVVLGRRVVVMGMARDNSIASAAFKVVGIVRTNNMAIDGTAAFINLVEAQQMFQVGQAVSQFSVLVNEANAIDLTRGAIVNALGNGYEVFTWAELFRGLEFMQKMMAGYSMVFYAIIFIVVAIGIFNIVLMSVLERVREFGIMLAVGSRFKQIAAIILLESILIGTTGFLIGSAVGYLLLGYFYLFGLDLSNFASALNSFGMAAVMRPNIALIYFTRSAVAVFTTSFLAALWPIRILKKLKPVESINFN